MSGNVKGFGDDSAPQGQQTRGPKRFDYHKKKDLGPTFFLRLPPPISGYDFREVSKHENLCVLQIFNEKTNSFKEFKIGATCLGEPSVCDGCQASIRQHRLVPKDKRGKDWIKHSKERKVSRVIPVWPLISNGDGTFKLEQSADPRLYELRSKFTGENIDWEDLKKLNGAMKAQGIDMTDPKTGIVVKVEYMKEPNSSGNGSPRDAYKHAPLILADKTPARIALPDTWEQSLRSYATFDELHFNLSVADMKLVCEVGEALEIARNDPGMNAALKAKKTVDLTNYLVANLENEAIKRVINAYSKGQRDDNQSAPVLAGRALLDQISGASDAQLSAYAAAAAKTLGGGSSPVVQAASAQPQQAAPAAPSESVPQAPAPVPQAPLPQPAAAESAVPATAGFDAPASAAVAQSAPTTPATPAQAPQSTPASPAAAPAAVGAVPGETFEQRIARLRAGVDAGGQPPKVG